jgi:hypothetical protein
MTEIKRMVGVKTDDREESTAGFKKTAGAKINDGRTGVKSTQLVKSDDVKGQEDNRDRD